MLRWIEKWWGLVALLWVAVSGLAWGLLNSPWNHVSAMICSVGIVVLFAWVVKPRGGSRPGTIGDASGPGFIGAPEKGDPSIGSWISNFFDGGGGGGHGGHGGGGFDGGGHGGGGHGGGHGG